MRPASLGRALSIGLVLGGVLAVPARPAAAVGGCLTSDPCIIVHLPHGVVEQVSSTTLRVEAAAAQGQPNGVPDGTAYPQRTNAGAPVADVTVTDALSVNALLTDLDPPVNLASVSFTEMPRPSDLTWSILPAAELSPAPSVFQNPALMPAYYAPAGQDQILYVRPLLDDADSNLVDNAVQSLSNPAGNELDLFVHTGPLLTVTAASTPAATASLKINQPVRLSARSTGDTVTPRFTWTVNGAPVSRRQDFTYSFAAAGVYEIQVSAAGADDSAGIADPMYFTVGTTHFKGQPVPGGSPPKPHPTPSRSTPTPAPGSTPSTTSGSGQPGGSATTTTSTSGANHGGPHGPAPAAQPTASPSASLPVPASGLPIVSGRLISGGVALASASGAIVDQTSTGVSPATPLSAGWRAGGLVAAGFAIMLLFAAGAARELRAVRRMRSAVRPR